jgi:hypothetical protein
MSTIVITIDDLEGLKEKSLSLYCDANVYGLTPEAFWGRCVMKSTIELLEKKGVELQVEFPSTFPFQIKS